MASVFKRGRRWYLRFKTASGKHAQEATAARTREEAKRLAAELELKHERIRRGTEVEPGDPTLTFGKLFEWWWQTHGSRMSPTTIATKGPAMRKHLLPKLEALTVREVTPARLERVFDELAEVLAGSSVNGHRSMLRSIFARAAKRGLWIGPNPVTNTERRRETRREFDSLSVDEVPKVLEQLDERWRALFATAIFTGLRKGELAALRRDDVDLVAGIIRVHRSWGSSTTKGRKEASVPIAAPLRPFLEQALRGHRSDFVFPGPDGGMMAADTKLQHVLRRALARAGVARAWLHVCRRTKPKRCGFTEERADDVSEPCPRCGFRLWPRAVHRQVRFHDLRATTATLLALSGAGLAVAQRVLRHSDPALTANIYTRVSLDQMRDALDGIVPAMVPPPAPAVLEPIAAAVNAPLAAHVLQPSEAVAGRHHRGDETSALLDASERAGRGIRTLDPCLGKTPPAGQHSFSPASTASPGLSVRELPSPPVRTDGILLTPDTPRRAAPVLQALPERPRELLRVRHVAELLRVSTATVYALCARGELEHVRVSNAIRIEVAAFERYLCSRRRS